MSDSMYATKANVSGSVKDWMAVLGVTIGAFLAIIDIQITNASLADIEGAISATPEEGSWISTGYLMAEIVVIPLSGWLPFVLGFRRYLLGSTALFLVCSIACAFSTTLFEMVVFRAGQGLTGGILIPTAFTTIALRLPARQHATGFAIFGLTANLAPAIGPALGGWLTENLSWQYVFYVNLMDRI